MATRSDILMFQIGTTGCLEQIYLDSLPQFEEPEWDLECDETGFPWDPDGQDTDLGNYEESDE